MRCGIGGRIESGESSTIYDTGGGGLPRHRSTHTEAVVNGNVWLIFRDCLVSRVIETRNSFGVILCAASSNNHIASQGDRETYPVC